MTDPLSIIDEEFDRIPLFNGGADAAADAPSKRGRKRKPQSGDGTTAKKKVRRVKRLDTKAALGAELQKMQDETDKGDEIAGVSGLQMRDEIAAAQHRAVTLLGELDELLDRSRDATEATTKYSQLLAQVKKHASKSVVLDKVAVLFAKLVAATEAARHSCSRLPREYAQVLLRQEAYMRASANALVPAGIAVLSPEAGNQLVSASPRSTTALTQYGGPQSRSTFRLVAADPSRARVAELQGSFLATSMLNANYDPAITVSATNAARREAQRRAAQLKAGGEVMPELFGHQQLLEATATATLPRIEGAGTASTKRLAIQAGAR